MNRRFRNRTNTNIDLTSLLDVIFILLMVVMVSQKVTQQQKYEQEVAKVEAAAAGMENAAAEAEKLKDAAADSKAMEQIYKEQLEAAQSVFDDVMIATVYVDYVPSDIKNRTIRLLINNETVTEIKVTPAEAGAAFLKFEDMLSQRIGEDPEKPFILTLDETQILYRDEKSVRKIINRLSAKYENLYIKAGGTNE